MKAWLPILVGSAALLLQGCEQQTADAGPKTPPTSESPIAYFRQLLVMTPEERAEELANRPEQQREGLQQKIAEYSAMPATERELRLRATELRYYLLPMMRLSREAQQERLQSVPEDIRGLVEDRLTQWMLIPPPFQQQLIDNQATLQLFSRLLPDSAPQADELVEDLHLNRIAANQPGYERWQTLSQTERTQLLKSFNHFFRLTATEKERTLRTLSPVERQAMQATLARFEALPPTQRTACIYGFQQFLLMPPDERTRFLENVDRWQTMAPEDREEWRAVVNRLSQMPPLPPGVEPLLVVAPPLPPGAAQ